MNIDASYFEPRLLLLASTTFNEGGGLSKIVQLIANEDKDTRGTVASISSMVQEVEERARDSEFLQHVATPA